MGADVAPSTLPAAALVPAWCAALVSVGVYEMRTGEAVNRLDAAGVLRQRDVGRQRYRVFEAVGVADLFTVSNAPWRAPPATP